MWSYKTVLCKKLANLSVDILGDLHHASLYLVLQTALQVTEGCSQNFLKIYFFCQLFKPLKLYHVWYLLLSNVLVILFKKLVSDGLPFLILLFEYKMSETLTFERIISSSKPSKQSKTESFSFCKWHRFRRILMER